MDVKYGISEGFTLDMTLVPDFGQVQSDNKVLNLSPFEVKYNENRPFFTEGTELFNKGNLFYSRRVGGAPIRAGDVYNQLNTGEEVVKNPQESKLINATKISGRTKDGLGIGFFNAITKPMYAEVEDAYGHKREVETGPLTNYNIMVLDQSLKNNSSVSLINTNVMRDGSDYDANVSAGLFNLNNKKNTFNWNGKFALSQLMTPSTKNTNGYSHDLGFGKTGGRWNFQLGQNLTDNEYNQNDMGYATNNNYIEHYLWTGYRWLKPKKWHNRIQLNFNAFQSQLYAKVPEQKVDSKFQSLELNVNANAQLKNLWFIGVFTGYQPHGYDFYEPRHTGYVYKTPIRKEFEVWMETNNAKKYHVSFDYFIALRDLFNSPSHHFNVQQSYRFNDKFSVRYGFSFNPAINDAGYYDPLDINGNSINIGDDVVFTKRNVTTVENIVNLKYNFNNRSGITVRIRHYSSEVENKELYDLQADGTLMPSIHSNSVPVFNKNFNIFNVDAVYTWQFAPGSFVNIVWKDESSLGDDNIQDGYFKNFNNTFASPQNNNLSVKIIYYLDYLNFKKWKKRE